MSSGVSGNLESGGTLLGASESSVGAVLATDFGNCHPNLLPFLDFAEGQFGPDPHLPVLRLINDCSSILGSSFMGGFGLVTLVGLYCYYSGNWEEATNLFFPQKDFLKSFLHQAMGYSCRLEHLLRVGVYHLEFLLALEV